MICVIWSYKQKAKVSWKEHSAKYIYRGSRIGLFCCKLKIILNQMGLASTQNGVLVVFECVSMTETFISKELLNLSLLSVILAF